jgi:hypothetical protein
VTDGAGAPVRTLTLDAAGGETLVVDVDLPAPAPPSSPPDRVAVASPTPVASQHRGPPLGTWIALGGAAVASGAAFAFGAMTLSARTEFNTAPSYDARDRFYRDRTITDVAWGIAGVAGALGVALWIAQPQGSGSGVALRARDGGVTLCHETRF